ncbi:MAG: DNA polymerase I [Planctomycetes bacterium]|nr:DNA polymerase I [Planctomycetota bacterium]
MPKRLFLIDGTALAYRSFFAFQGTGRAPLATSQGHPTAATYGFCTTLRALLERERPDALAIAFDGPRADLARTAVYPDYKSTRAKMPDEMRVQMADIRAAAEGFGIRVVESETDEADDVIGTLAVQGRDAGMQVFIVTGDKDFLQLVGDRIRLWNLRSSTSKPEIVDAEACTAKWGVGPASMVDLLALMGDSSDDVPGVPKVGEKTAVQLLQKFGSLDQLLARTAEVEKASIRQSLEAHRDLALLSRRLVTLRLDVPLPLRAEDLGPAAPDFERLRPLFLRLEFTNLLEKLAAQPAPQADVEQRYSVVRTAGELEVLLGQAGAVEHIGLAALGTGGHLRGQQLVGIAFALAPGRAAYVPLQLDPPVLPGGREPLLAALRPVLEAGRPRKAVHDGKRAMLLLRTAGIELGGFDFDPMLASYCLEPGVASHSLEALALRRFAFKKTAPKELVGTGSKQRTFDQVDPALAGGYVNEAADLALRLRAVLEPELDAQGVTALYRELELPLVPVLLDMEWEGIAIDREHLQALSQELRRRIGALEQRVHERAGAPFNLASPQQLGKVLFDDLEVHRLADLPKPKRTPTGQYKTDHDVLEQLARHHEVPALVLEWRQLTKLAGTYVDSLPQMVDPATGRVHTTFNQGVAATGRLSSEDPNLQNIPIRTDEGRRVREAFVPRAPGWVLLSADYSQIELRILAHLSGDRALVDSFQKGEDIHARTAALVHGLLPTLVTPELRNQAKVINYGLMYGMGASRLAAETGMRPPEAKRFIEQYFRALPGVKRYLDGSLQQAREQRQARTMFGRRRPLPDIDSTNAMLRIAAENMAVNTPIQGAAADIVKRAMLAVHGELRRRGLRARLLLQVHDELVLDVPEAELLEVERLVRDAMQGAAELAVPLEVSMGHGRNWLLAH